MDESAWYQEWNYILRLDHDFSDFFINLAKLTFKFHFFLNKRLVLNLDGFEFTNFGYQNLFEFRAKSFLLKLMETVHDNILWMNVFNPHHVE